MTLERKTGQKEKEEEQKKKKTFHFGQTTAERRVSNHLFN
jgi:hypothetical protein